MGARDESYNGCARHAAQHMLDFLGYKYSVSELGKYVKLYPDVYWITKPNKATTPGDLNGGLNKVLGEKGESVRTAVKVRITNPQGNVILPHVKDNGPVIALVEGGKHWVTAMGYWQPLLQPQNHGYFYTFSNDSTVLEPWGYYNLRFSDAFKPVARTLAKSYVQGTTIRLVPLPPSIAFSWNNLGSGFEYSLDIETRSGQTWAPCADSNTVRTSASYTFRGSCPGRATVPVSEVSRARVCAARDDRWNQATCSAYTRVTGGSLWLTIPPP
jgi:hypothetical protein